MVISELVYVLEKVFELQKNEICKKVKVLVLKENMIVENKQVVFRALDTYCDLNVDFVDAYVYSHSFKNNINKVFSFDEHLRRFEGLEIISD